MKVSVNRKVKKNNRKTSVTKSPVKRRVSRRRLLNAQQTQQLKKLHENSKLTIRQIAKKFNISVATLYNYLKRI